ncbi:DNA endonuclease RBBP8 [Hippocampus zosterae]|uniref:DNA endonuclease RBBP8 n=1 Tax=Hippocampus zosterae TaxID=109293 RepID=UPI00223E603B|nr:DNA endonuclease RBBP8 [Hippocampus zosterae]XP_051910537.1 DNA endonuclease RBBP8 [Hippocampus zosterae]
MSSPTGTPKPADPFYNLWLQLRECHQEGLQGLEEKVCKLKKERRLDAESLQLFYTHNQELKEQTKTLQDANRLLEDRLRTKECNRCATLEENLKKWQDHSEQTISKLKYERKCLEDENRKLQAELQILKTCSEPQAALSPEHEDGIIPDSPVLASSLPAANKLKKRKYTDNSRHVHYAEDFNWALFKDQESNDTTRLAKRTQMLAPNTCEMETSQILGEEENGVIADTCGLELVNTLHIKTTAEGKQFSSKPSRSSGVRPKPRRMSSLSAPIHSPDSTTAKSSSLLPRGEKLTDSGDLGKDKTTKDDDDDEAKGPEDGETCDRVNGKKSDSRVEPMKQTCKTMKAQSFTEPPGSRVQTLNQALNVDCGSPAFKKPNQIPKEDHRRRSHPQVQSATHKRALPENAQRKHTVENMWSIDPALALSMYDSEQGADEDTEQQREELLDSDCTWISHSLLQGRGEEDEDERGVSGIGDKANDSLDRMFDTTAHEEYISYNTSQVASCPSEDEEEQDEKESPEKSPRLRKVQHPTFAHAAVVRKKDERRKLKGTTCKECEVYYAHLPEEEKVKKLSECSRHRHRFIPPSTPENFWEVGFPSTQTCIERGYIKEEQMPQSRLRRKQPFAALFSPKNSQQES